MTPDLLTIWLLGCTLLAVSAWRRLPGPLAYLLGVSGAGLVAASLGAGWVS